MKTMKKKYIQAPRTYREHMITEQLLNVISGVTDGTGTSVPDVTIDNDGSTEPARVKRHTFNVWEDTDEQ